MMEKMSIKQYALKHKLSIFNVMKMVKSGKLNTIIEEEEGREVTYILLDEKIEKDIKKGIVSLDERESATIKEEIRQLKEEVKRLKDEVEMLKKECTKGV